jgi:hypothetical protein
MLLTASSWRRLNFTCGICSIAKQSLGPVCILIPGISTSPCAGKRRLIPPDETGIVAPLQL